MITNITQTDKDIQTMSSLEIAELTGKTHSHVLRDIDNMLIIVNPDLDSPLNSATYKDGNNIERRHFNLNKNLTLTLISGYNIKLRYTIIKRWQELETIEEPKSIQPINPLTQQLEGLKFLADEFNIQGVDKINMFENGLAKFPDIIKALPSYSTSSISAKVAQSYSGHKSDNDEVLISATAFNKLAKSHKILEQITRKNGKKFWSVTDKGLKYGLNKVSRQSSSITQPHWYDDTFKELYKVVQQ